jgi:hypothetical protein
LYSGGGLTNEIFGVFNKGCGLDLKKGISLSGPRGDEYTDISENGIRCGAAA